nr:hypothetical protein CISIN_1g027598mg [Ipomoea batatas]
MSRSFQNPTNLKTHESINARILNLLSGKNLSIPLPHPHPFGLLHLRAQINPHQILQPNILQRRTPRLVRREAPELHRVCHQHAVVFLQLLQVVLDPHSDEAVARVAQEPYEPELEDQAAAPHAELERCHRVPPLRVTGPPLYVQAHDEAVEAVAMDVLNLGDPFDDLSRSLQNPTNLKGDESINAGILNLLFREPALIPPAQPHPSRLTHLRSKIVVFHELRNVVVDSDADEGVVGVGEEVSELERDVAAVEELEDEAAAADAELESRRRVVLVAGDFLNFLKERGYVTVMDLSRTQDHIGVPYPGVAMCPVPDGYPRSRLKRERRRGKNLEIGDGDGGLF